MPTIPTTHGIRGRALDKDGNIVTSGMVVAINLSQGDRPITTSQINSQGIWAIDCGNFGSFSNGDLILFLLDDGNKMEGHDVVDRIARDIIMQTRNQIRNYSSTSNVLFSPNIINNFPHPFDEEHNLFRRTVEIQLKSFNVNE